MLRTIEVWASNAHLCLILLLFNFALVCAEANKQSTVSTLFPYPWLKPPPPPLTPLCLPLSPLVETHLDTHRHALQRMQRYRSYIEAAFQWSPHGVDDRVLLKRKKACRGDFKSEEDIRKIHWKKLPLAVSSLFFFFFYSQEQFCTFPSEGNVCSVERGQEEGRDAVFFV